MNHMKHTETPWSIGPVLENDTSARLFSGTRYIGAIWNSDENIEQSRINADHIVKCVNAHDMLINTLKMIAGGCCNQGVCIEYAASALRDLGIEVKT